MFIEKLIIESRIFQTQKIAVIKQKQFGSSKESTTLSEHQINIKLIFFTYLVAIWFLTSP